MSEITRRLSVVELSERILEMAKTGVYRESVLEALKPVATQKQIRQAIAHAKQFGLHSVATLRDAELGTYYQVDLVKYRALQSTLRQAVPLMEDGELAKRHLEAIALVQRLLQTARIVALGLGVGGVACVLVGYSQVSMGLWSGSLCTGLLWLLQRELSRRGLV